MQNTDSKEQRLKLLNWLTLGRVIILLLLLIVTYIGARFSNSITTATIKLSLLLGVAFLLAAIYALWARYKKAINVLIWSQIVIDVALVTLAVYWTGESRSPFTFLYPLVIVSASLLMGRTGGTVSAVLSTISFALLCLWPHVDSNSSLFTFFLNMAAFNITAALGVTLAQRLKLIQSRLSKAQVDLRRMEQIQRHLARSIRSGLITVDNELKITFFNQAASDILGVDLRDFYGKPIKEIWPDAERLLLSPQQVDSSVNRNELILRDDLGKEKFLGISIFPLTDEEGNSLGYGFIFQDITEIKAREERLQRMDKLAALGEMAAGLAHEIRNPLASLCGAAQFLAEADLIKPGGERLLQIITRESERLNRLTETFLLYARPEKGTGKPVAIFKEIKTIIDLISQRKGLPECKFSLDIDENLNVVMDPDQFRQVILNIVLNARQALPQEGGHISIFAHKKKDFVEIIIRDTGKGIDQKDLPHIFDPFFTTRADGTGLGLSVVHRLINAHGGDIQVESKLGHGTSFIIHLPYIHDKNCVDEQINIHSNISRNINKGIGFAEVNNNI